MILSSLIMKGSTVIVGLNGALQKRFVLSPDQTLIPGNVHRASDISTGVGGKGQDVAVTLSCLQFDGNLQLAQFVGGGAEGDVVHQMLSDLLGSTAMRLSVRTKSNMRTCTSIVAADTTTELVEPSGFIASKEMEELMNDLKDMEASAICIMGTMPPGCAADTYANIYKSVAGPNTLCLIDSVAGLGPLLKAIAERENHGLTILKVNASELCRLASVPKTKSEAGGVQIQELVSAVTTFIHKFHALKALNAIAITDGAHPAHLAVMPIAGELEFRLFELPIADLKEDNPNLTLFPIGAGDAVAAGTLAAWKSLTDGPGAKPCVHSDVAAALKGNESPASRAMLTAFSFGLACGSASCLQEQNSVLKVQDALRLYNKEGRPTFLSSHKIS